jgi:chemotaxis protein methyltransferase CheR
MPDSLASAEGRMPGRSVAEREFRFTRADFVAIAAALRAEAGISLPDGKAPLVYARLAKRLRTLELSSFRDYTALLAGPAGIEERRQLVTALTTNVTRFFREPHHFDHLREAVLPPLLLESGRKGARVRLWSAACSTGQEAYSIAAVVTDLLPEAASLDLKVLATDIDPVVPIRRDPGATVRSRACQPGCSAGSSETANAGRRIAVCARCSLSSRST